MFLDSQVVQIQGSHLDNYLAKLRETGLEKSHAVASDVIYYIIRLVQICTKHQVWGICYIEAVQYPGEMGSLAGTVAER